MIRLKWKYVWPYLVFGASIAILVILNARVIQSSIDSNDHFAQTINLAGRQRMLSQRLATYTLLPAGEVNKDDFNRDLLLWDRMHHSLQSGDALYSIRKLSYTGIQELFRQLNPVQQNLQQLLVDALVHPADDARKKEIFAEQTKYLSIMDKIVKAFEKEAMHSYISVRDKQVWLAVISGLVLILEILVLVVPYHRKLILAYRQLKDQKIRLEEQNEEIEQQNYTLSHQNTELDRMHRTEALILKGTNAGVWNWDITTGNEEWSDRFFTLLGYMPGEIPATFSTFLNKLLHAEDKERVEAAIQAHLERNEKYHLNIRLQNKDGNYKWYEASGQAARDIHDKPVQMAGSVIDVNEMVSYGRELEALNQTKDKLFAIIAHDLRSPIAGLKSLLDVQENGIITQEEFLEYLDIVKENTFFLSQTLDNILHWASGQMKGFVHNPQPVNLTDIVNTALKFYRGSAAQKNISMLADMEGDHWVYADRDHLFLAVRNVLNNAIKFTAEGGSISLVVRKNGDKEQILIRDTGVGMSKEDIHAILSGQLQSSRPGTNREKGTGLGLSLSVGVIRENKGSLFIESVPDKGSTFVISFPEAAAPSA